MLRALMAGVLSMLAVVPPAVAQDERGRGERGQGERGQGERAARSADRGDWRRERGAAPVMWSGQGRDGPRMSAPAAPPPEQRPQPQVDRSWGGARPTTPDRGDATPRATPDRGGWRGGEQGWGGARPAVPERGDAVRQAPSGARGWGGSPGWRRDDARAPGDRDRREMRGRDGVGRPVRGMWRSDRDGGSYERPAQGGGVWRSERTESRRSDRDARRDSRWGDDGDRAGRGAAYRLPRYYAPSGWNRGYRRFGVGVRLAPMLFARSYWIDDPWSYQLPDADDRYRWVRYYGDALLVDLDSGQVVEVIHDIFE